MPVDISSVVITDTIKNMGAKMVFRVVCATVVGHIVYNEALSGENIAAGSWVWALSGAVALVIADWIYAFVVGEMTKERARNVAQTEDIKKGARKEIMQEELESMGYMVNPRNGEIVKITPIVRD